MNLYYQQALNILEEFPNNEAKNSLIKLLEYVIKREK
jgi:geranylgeranyl pyrophosphate synthase